jgi:hypothetical protein
LQKHPDKTFIGRIEKGFDFLGYRLWPDRIAVAEATVERFRARLTQLYEQEGGRPHAAAPLGSYVRRWLSWATCSPDVHASRASDIAWTCELCTCPHVPKPLSWMTTIRLTLISRDATPRDLSSAKEVAQIDSCTIASPIGAWL